jgi:hypothetical protein
MNAEFFASASGGLAVLKYMDTAIKVAQFLLSDNLKATVQNIRGYFQKSDTPVPEGFEPDKALNLISALTIIDPRILGVLRDQVDRAIAEYATCLQRSTTPQERDACDRRSERTVCEALNRLMDRNGGYLPHDEYLEAQWNSYGCIRY